MTEQYIASNNISVYPSARRGVERPESRLVTESALVRIVNKLIDTEGFVISSEFTDASPFEFNIYGYYFKISPANAITSFILSPVENQTIYGVINLASVSDDITELSGQDEDGAYTGIKFTDQEITGDGIKCLALLKYTSGNWIIVPESKLKFNSSSSQQTNVDGGII